MSESGKQCEAQDSIDRVFVPAFKAGAFSAGTEDGTGVVNDRIARAHYAGGERGTHTEKHRLEKATRSSAGKGEKAATCPHCGCHTMAI